MRRRTFLQTMTVGSATIAAFLYPGITKVLGQTTPASGLAVAANDSFWDPDIARGRVAEVTTNGVILEVGKDMHVVRIAANTLVWKEFYQAPKEVPLQIGDRVTAQGTGLSDGSVDAQRLWVNIGRLDGVIDQISSQEMTIINKDGQARRVVMSMKVAVVNAKTDAVLPNHIASLQKGQDVGRVGLRLPDGVLRATKIWWAEPEA